MWLKIYLIYYRKEKKMFLCHPTIKFYIPSIGTVDTVFDINFNSIFFIYIFFKYKFIIGYYSNCILEINVIRLWYRGRKVDTLNISIQLMAEPVLTIILKSILGVNLGSRPVIFPSTYLKKKTRYMKEFRRMFRNVAYIFRDALPKTGDFWKQCYCLVLVRLEPDLI